MKTSIEYFEERLNNVKYDIVSGEKNGYYHQLQNPEFLQTEVDKIVIKCSHNVNSLFNYAMKNWDNLYHCVCVEIYWRIVALRGETKYNTNLN